MTSRQRLLAPFLTILTVLLVKGVDFHASAPPSPVPGNAAEPVRQAQIPNTYGQLPLSFEANQGQTADQVKFLARGGGYSLFLTAGEAILALRPSARAATTSSEEAQAGEPAVLRLQLVGADPQPRVVGLEELPGKANYFIGDDPAGWRTNVPTYAKAEYQNIYPGVDLVYYGEQGQLEYDFVVAPGADPEAITLGFQGADRLEVDGSGDLVLGVSEGQVIQRAPRIYQEIAGVRRVISGGYQLKDAGQVGFRLGAYDPTYPLVIDPVLVYSTYLGGSGDDGGSRIAVDGAGNAYVGGSTTSTDFPLVNAWQTASGGAWDAFVAKLSPSGDTLLYATYLGGTSLEQGWGIAVDGAGNAYVTGQTSSTNFPLVNVWQSAYAGGTYDAFAAKLSPSGDTLLYATYLGGRGLDLGYAVAVDRVGNAYVTGQTSSTNFPLVDPWQPAHGGGTYDGFVAKLSPDGDTLLYATYLGGGGDDLGDGIAVDGTGNAYATGRTASTDFPLVDPWQPAYGGGVDAFVAKLSPDGDTLLYATYLGGRGFEWAVVAVDGAGNAYVAGSTSSTDFPLVAPWQPAYGGGTYDAFVAKLSHDGDTLLYATYLGGRGFDHAVGIAVDGAGNAYVTGQTSSTNFPLVDPWQPAYGGGSFDAFVTKLSRDGDTLLYATYLGGRDDDLGRGIAVDGVGNAYLTGLTYSTGFPLVDPWQPAYGGGSFDGFVAKLGLAPQAAIQRLIDEVDALVAAGALNPGQGNALIVKLEAALQQWERCHAKTAANQLGAFINQVTDFIADGVLAPEQGQPLIEAAQAIIDQLEAMTLLPTRGGTLMLSPQIWLTAGPGTFEEAVQVECVAHAPLATEPLYDIDLFFELGASYPDGSPAQPGRPYTLTVRYDAATLPAAVDEVFLGLYSYQENTWAREPSSSANVDARVVTAQPDHFSLWSVLAPEPHSLYLPWILKDTTGPSSSRPGD